MPPIMLQQLMLQQQMSQRSNMQQQMQPEMFRNMSQPQQRFIGSENDENVHIQKLLNQTKYDF